MLLTFTNQPACTQIMVANDDTAVWWGWGRCGRVGGNATFSPSLFVSLSRFHGVGRCQR